MKRSKQLSIADKVTLLGIASAFLSLGVLVSGESTELAVSLVLLAIFFDFIDGKLARKYGGSHMGPVLDTIFDVLGFVVFPVLLLYVEGDLPVPFLIGATTLYSIAACWRLARFTVEGFADKKLSYRGMPVLCSVYAILLISIFSGWLSGIILLVMAPLMVSNLRFPKPNHFGYGIILIILSVGFFWHAF